MQPQNKNEIKIKMKNTADVLSAITNWSQNIAKDAWNLVRLWQ